MQKLPALLQSPQFKLKLFVWLVFLVLFASAWFIRFAANVMVGEVYPELFPKQAFPALATELAWLRAEGTWFAVLSPWFLFAIVSGLRPTVSEEHCLVFAGSVVVAQLVMMAITVDALLAPVVELVLGDSYRY
jgi:hypothetical protein